MDNEVVAIVVLVHPLVVVVIVLKLFRKPIKDDLEDLFDMVVGHAHVEGTTMALVGIEGISFI